MRIIDLNHRLYSRGEHSSQQESLSANSETGVGNTRDGK